MHLCAITDEISQDLAHALSVLREFGADRAELRNVYGTYLVDGDEALIARAESELKSAGFSVSCLDTPLFKCDLDENAAPMGATHGATERTYADQQTLLLRAIDLAKRFDTPYLRIFSFWKRGRLTPEIEDRIADALVRPCELAERAGITLLLENEHACYLGTAAETARVINRVGSPALRMIFDPGNSFMAGENPFPAGFDAARTYLAHLHVKDACVDEAGMPNWCAVGAGAIAYPALFAALKTSGYNGAVSLETHYKEADGDGEKATRESLGNLKRLLDQAEAAQVEQA